MDAVPRSSAYATFMVEGYWADSSLDTALDSVRRLGASLEELAPDGLRMRTVSMTLVPADKAAYWVVDGPSRELVGQACARAGLLIERIVEAIELRSVSGDGSASVTGRPVATRMGPDWSGEGGIKDVASR